MERREIMTLEEVADYLRVSERTVYDWAQKGDIPCGKLGTAWRFKRDDIEEWVDERLGTKPKRQVTSCELSELLDEESVIIVESDNKAEILCQMIEVLSKKSDVRDKKLLKKGIFYREELMSTGIGMGVAIPHVRNDAVKDIVMCAALSRCDIVDYESLDEVPVRLLFMIAAREDQHTQHLRILSSISTLLKDFELKEALLQAETSAAFCKILKEFDD